MNAIFTFTRIAKNLIVTDCFCNKRKIKFPKYLTVFCFLLLGTFQLKAQTAGDYRSNASGDWSSTIWERYDGSVWVGLVAPPSSTDNVITIAASNTVTVSSAITADQISVEGSLSISPTGQLVINDGAGIDMDVISGGTVTNIGMIQINSGTVNFNTATFTNFGTVQFSTGAVLDLLNNTTGLNGNTVITGTGTINLNGGNTAIGFAVQIPSGMSVNFSAGVIQGANKLRFLNAATMNWSGGELTGNANTEFDNGATLNITGNVGLRGNHYITNNGTINWNSTGNIVYDGGSSNSAIINNSIFNIGNSGGILNTLGGSNFFDLSNSVTGIINKTNGITTFDGNVFLTNSGTINVNSGDLRLNGSAVSSHAGTFNIAAAGTLSGTNSITYTGTNFVNNGTVNLSSNIINNGTYKGSGTYTGSSFFNNTSGIVAPGNSPGCQTFSNGFISSGALNIEVNGTTTACTDYDKITVTGTATLGGSTLNVTVGYTPVNNDRVTIIAATALSPGTFATVNAPAGWSVLYNSPSAGMVTLVYTAPCNVNIPDANLKAALLANAAINTNADGEIQCTEAAAFAGTINVANLGIQNMTGIEAFTHITSLVCNNNPLTTPLNVSANTALVQLVCNNDNLTSLNVNNNTALTTLFCYSNSLTSLNVSNNTALFSLYCYFNNLTSLDVSNNTSLNQLNCLSNSITALNVGNCTGLTLLNCANNPITALNLAQNTSLSSLTINNTQIQTINLSANTALNFFSANGAQLTSLDLSANTALTFVNAISNSSLASINVKNGNNANITALDVRGSSSSLTCIQVDNVANANGYTGWLKDAGANYSTNCSVTLPQITAPADITVCQNAATGLCNYFFNAQTIPSTVVINYNNRFITYNNVSINGGGNAATVAPGSSVSLGYNLSVSYNSNGNDCPGCSVQSAIGIGNTLQTLQCEPSIFNGYNRSYTSGNFTAPVVPGVYYLTQIGSLNFTCERYTFPNTPADAIGVIIVGAPYPTVTGGSGAVTITNDAPSCFPVGNTTVTWTVTDALNNTSTSTQNITVTAGTVYYRDSDGDGFGNTGYSVYSCSQPPTFVLIGGDCNDYNASIGNCNPPTPAAALNFDGVDDKIIVANGADLSNKSFSVEAWLSLNFTI